MMKPRSQEATTKYRVWCPYFIPFLFMFVLAPMLTLMSAGTMHVAHAQPAIALEDNSLGQAPLLGWSSWSSILQGSS